MGNATVIENIGTGLYRVRLDYDLASVDNAIALLQAQYIESAALITAAEVSVLEAEELRNAAAAGMNAIVDLWKSELIKPGAEDPLPIPPAIPGPDPSDAELATALFDALNAARSAVSVGDVERNATLDAAAWNVLQAVASRGTLRDRMTPANRAAEAGYSYSGLIGVGGGIAAAVTDPAVAVANMPQYTTLGANYVDAGCAYAYKPTSLYSYLWCVILAAPGSINTVVAPKTNPAKKADDDETTKLDKIEPPLPDIDTPEKLGQASAELAKAAAGYRVAKKELDALVLEQDERARQINRLLAQKSSLETPVHAWSARYDVQYAADDSVPMAEVPGWRDRTETPATTEIAGETVAYQERALNILPVGSANRGRLRSAEVMSSELVFVNLAMEPGQLKWEPRWRYGTITRVADGYADVTFETTDARTAPGLGTGLNLDYAEWWPYVPIAYPCPDAFAVGDEVLIDYEGQDIQYPVVVGFRREPRQCVIPSGLLYWNALVPFYPLRIVVGDLLLRYRPPLVSGQPYMLSRTWTDTRPDIEYPDTLGNDYYVDLNYWPSMWSGLARLAVQGCHAIARDPRAIFGSGIDHKRQGIVRDSGYRYWRVSITSAGIRAAKLSLPSEQVDQLPGQALAVLQAGTFTDSTDRDVLEARVLAYLEPETDVEIATATEIGAVLAEGFAMAYGWHFARGILEASIVTFREECMPEFVEITCIGQFVCSLYTVAFITADVDGVRQMTDATITLVDGPTRSRPRTAWTSIYKPSYGTNYSWNYSGVVPGWGENPLPACCYDSIGEIIQPLYCFYDKSDVLQVAWYIQYQFYYTEGDSRGATGVCSPPYTRSGQYGYFGSQIGGFYIGPTAPDKEDYRDGSYDYTAEDYTITLESLSETIYEWDSPTTSDVNFVNSTGLFCSGGDLYDWYQERSPYSSDPPFPKVGYVEMWAHKGYQTEELNLQTFSADPRAWTMVIAAYDCEAVYILTSSKEVVVGQQKRYSFEGASYNNGANEFFGGAIDYKFYSTGTPTLIREITLSDLNKHLETPYYQFGGWYGWVQNLATRTGMTIVAEGSTTITPPSYILFTPHGAVELPEDGYWPTLFPESVLDGLTISGQPVKALLSYGGQGLYSPEESEYTITGGYDAGSKDPGLEAFFVGGA